MPASKSIKNRTFNKLFVLEDRVERAGKDDWFILCQCACGKKKLSRRASVIAGTAASCGTGKCHSTYKHGWRGTPTYECWNSMRDRCNNESNKDYRRYGGRGIRVSPVFDDFMVFLAEVGPRPSRLHSLDRIDNDRGYEPGNLRWATVKEQANNRRSNVFVEYAGLRLTMTQWAEKLGIGVSTLFMRKQAGWPVAEMLTRVVQRKSKRIVA